MKLPWPLLSLLRRFMVLSLLLRARGVVLPSDCVEEEEELLRLRTVWLGIVCVVVVGGLMLWLMLRLMCLVIVI
jgi:hypothetical protein